MRGKWIVLAALVLAGGAQAQDVAATQPIKLPASPATVAWGYYDAAAKPVLTIKSGDRVEIQTLLTNSPPTLAANGVPSEQIEQELRDIHAQVKTRGPGGHMLTGPIFVEG